MRKHSLSSPAWTGRDRSWTSRIPTPCAWRSSSSSSRDCTSANASTRPRSTEVRCMADKGRPGGFAGGYPPLGGRVRGRSPHVFSVWDGTQDPMGDETDALFDRLSEDVFHGWDFETALRRLLSQGWRDRQ